MCWRCVSDSVPYVLGSVVVIKAMGSRVVRGDASADPEPAADDAAEPVDLRMP